MRVYDNFDLTYFNSYRIKAVCRKAFFPENDEDVKECFLDKKNLILLGSGHNIILSKEYYDNDFLIFNGNFNNISVLDNLMIVDSGAMMSEVSKIALQESLSGLEIFYDIPSSLGGAIVMNAGASGEEIKDVLEKVIYLDLKDGKTKEILKENMSFEYRNSFFQKNTDKIVLRAFLKLRPGNKETIALKMENIKASRWLKQPKAFPNSGSVFKRPKGFYVGAIMDDLNLKGFTIGGAKISEKHGGFIINHNNASGLDILKIIEHVKSKVKEAYNLDLEVEQRVI